MSFSLESENPDAPKKREVGAEERRKRGRAQSRSGSRGSEAAGPTVHIAGGAQGATQNILRTRELDPGPFCTTSAQPPQGCTQDDVLRGGHDSRATAWNGQRFSKPAVCPHLLGSLSAQAASQPATYAELQGPPTCHRPWEALHTVLVTAWLKALSSEGSWRRRPAWTLWQPHSHIRIGNPRRHKGPYSEPWGSRSRWQAGAPDGPLGRTCPGPPALRRLPQD